MSSRHLVPGSIEQHALAFVVVFAVTGITATYYGDVVDGAR